MHSKKVKVRIAENKLRRRLRRRYRYKANVVVHETDVSELNLGRGLFKPVFYLYTPPPSP